MRVCLCDVSNTLPGPQQLQMVINAAKEYAELKKEKTTSSPSSSMNSVIHHLESASSRSSGSTRTSMQCVNCSFVYDPMLGIVEGSTCILCKLGVVARARPGALTNFDLVMSGIQIAAHATETAASMVKLQTQSRINTSSICRSPPLTPQKYNSIPAIKTSRSKPQVWPCGKKCDMCMDKQAVRFCVSCEYKCTHNTALYIIVQAMLG